MRKTILCGVLFGLLAPLAWGQSGLHGGREIYEAACAACHGSHGEGTPKVVAGFDPPETFPHFNK
ncbi:MAG TPA: c-type cytochrome, partial [Steroidobacteraceae bacterium]|nr:c-type cytochrome [Steroidobacteraceae bacterium]